MFDQSAPSGLANEESEAPCRMQTSGNTQRERAKLPALSLCVCVSVPSGGAQWLGRSQNVGAGRPARCP
jgi:hypothetical protein